jgi:hypothetical protein
MESTSATIAPSKLIFQKSPPDFSENVATVKLPDSLPGNPALWDISEIIHESSHAYEHVILIEIAESVSGGDLIALEIPYRGAAMLE